jgi:hypothetical protein
VENGAGVPAYRLSKAERGQLQLNDAEQSALRSYYAARCHMAMGDKGPDRVSDLALKF